MTPRILEKFYFASGDNFLCYDDCPEDKVKDHNGRCVPEGEEVPSIEMFVTILCMVAAGILHKRRIL